jgi:hypothetical protein
VKYYIRRANLAKKRKSISSSSQEKVPASEHISEQNMGEPVSLCEQLLQGLRQPVVRSKSDFLRTEGSRTPLGRKPHGATKGKRSPTARKI